MRIICQNRGRRKIEKIVNGKIQSRHQQSELNFTRREIADMLDNREPDMHVRFFIILIH